MSKDELSQNKSSSSLGDDWEIDTNILASEVNTLSVNEEERISRWTRLLGVTNTPNPLDNWDQLYNLNNQCALRNDCRKLANVLKNTRSVPELESFLTLYCKNRGTDYIKNIGWVKILENIMLLNIPQTHEFNVFFAFTTKYIPKDLRPQSELYNLFHLLLQYHDPQLSNYLDSLHCYPALYSKSWFGTLFSSSLSTEACLELWTLYIEQVS
uniref:Rab-GAP TBC domain-containing protein n=1 Tax=Caenorhabditis japonica TaxID=281687 RepID=A0A8R1IYI2_CAEJA